jgi:hypothetical protein
MAERFTPDLRTPPVFVILAEVQPGCWGVASVYNPVDNVYGALICVPDLVRLGRDSAAATGHVHILRRLDGGEDLETIEPGPR